MLGGHTTFCKKFVSLIDGFLDVFEAFTDAGEGVQHGGLLIAFEYGFSTLDGGEAFFEAFFKSW